MSRPGFDEDWSHCSMLTNYHNPLHANAESLVKGRSHDTVSMETHTHPS